MQYTTINSMSSVNMISHPYNFHPTWDSQLVVQIRYSPLPSAQSQRAAQSYLDCYTSPALRINALHDYKTWMPLS